ncbi:MAG: hypothetical protein FJ395_05980 [Verrucomicrobia bacterium]|nr:hypothetical protein [Verrucomicrobiota bacterium]
MKKKAFDCVQMKWDIQRKLRKEYEGLTVAERNRLAEAKILADPILGPWWRKVRKRSVEPMTVAESPAVYRPRRRSGRGRK